MSCVSIAQNCQGSRDYEDIYGQDAIEDRPFMCGTGLMEKDRYFDRKKREEKGFYDIAGVSFYGHQGYYQKEDKLYYSDKYDSFKLVKGGDVSSLEVAGNFVRDQHAVYVNGKPQSIVDIETFRVIENSPYALDKNRVYYSSTVRYASANGSIEVIEGAEPASFEAACTDSYICRNYGKDANHVYYNNQIIKDADPNSFQLNDHGYGFDDQHVYFYGLLIEGSHGGSFESVDYYYFKDRSQVYYYGKVIEGMDGSSFKVFPNSNIGTDGSLVCCHDRIMEEADAASFMDLGCGYFKDQKHVFSKGMVVKGVDPGSFVIMDWGFTADKNHVYCDNEVIPGANPETFEVLGRKYSRDKKNVYYLDRIIKGADLKSFVASEEDPNKAHDSKATYHRGEKM